MEHTIQVLKEHGIPVLKTTKDTITVVTPYTYKSMFDNNKVLHGQSIDLIGNDIESVYEYLQY